jgi:uroporphyrinogen decarboxylase
MGKREDMRAALQRRKSEGAVPVWEVEFQAWDAASGKHVVLGHEFEALSQQEQEKALRSNAEILVATSVEMGYAALSVPSAYWEQSPGVLAYYVLPGEARWRQIEILREVAPRELMLTGCSGGIIGADYSVDFCQRLFDDPESIDELAEKYLRWGIDGAKRLRDCGVEAAVTASDMADNSGPFFNPGQMERWVLPYLTKWSDEIRKMGMFSIMHSDGNLTKYLDAIAATGLDALQAIDPVAGMDMGQAREIVGDRLCLCGNIDCGLLLTGRPEQVQQATSDLLKLCKTGGGFVLGASNAVQREVPMENYRAMIQAWKEFGRYETRPN